MAVVAVDSGTKTTTGSEQTLSTQTTARAYVLALDLTAMVLGHVLTVRAYVKTLSGSSHAMLYEVSFAHVQSAVNWQSIPVPTTHSVEFRFILESGANIDIPWEVIGL